MRNIDSLELLSIIEIINDDTLKINNASSEEDIPIIKIHLKTHWFPLHFT